MQIMVHGPDMLLSYSMTRRQLLLSASALAALRAAEAT